MSRKAVVTSVAFLFAFVFVRAALGADWQPKAAPLMTRWAADVSPEKVHPEYPRPQMVREHWLNLNGLWDYGIRPREESRPQQYDGQILVPFPVESALSGVMQRVDENQRLWYRRTFTVPAEWNGKSVLLHFGAVDWESTVWINGKECGTHRGGYDPFTYDITEQLTANGPQELVVSVWDPSSAGTQPRGKQVRNPEGIWYTPTTGIWQTVWLEPVPLSRIGNLVITPDVDKGVVFIDASDTHVVQTIRGSHHLEVGLLAGGREVASGTGPLNAPGPDCLVAVPAPRLWSPEDPFLYDLRVRLVWKDGAERKVVDEVSSYCGLRKVALGKDGQGVTRIYLNDKPYFMFGPLDQGFWPDGLYTAPTDEALRYDIEMTKKLGFNTARKHVKIEPQRWYYWCDKLGLIVWQDMPSGDSFASQEKHEIQRSPESAAQFERELARMVESHSNHPSIVIWVPFNEGWGQYDTARIVELVHRLDATRLVIGASGWWDTGVGDINDIHDYPGPKSPSPEPARAAVLGEFGGLGLPLPGHTWQVEGSWGYRKFNSPAELTDAYVAVVENLPALIAEPGLSAAIYTQTSDVEIEVNGLMTYDRALVKMDAERITAANRKVYSPPARKELSARRVGASRMCEAQSPLN